MSKRVCFSDDDYPLFQGDFDLWNSLDDSVQQQVLDGLGLLLLRYLSHADRSTDEESFLQKGNQR
jgi:hypothetical protein